MVATHLHRSPTTCRQVIICFSSCEFAVLSHFLSESGTDLVASFLFMSSLPVQSLVGGAASSSTVLFLHLVGHEPSLFIFLAAGQVPLACLAQVVLGICLYVPRQANTAAHIHVNITHCIYTPELISPHMHTVIQTHALFMSD